MNKLKNVAFGFSLIVAGVAILTPIYADYKNNRVDEYIAKVLKEEGREVPRSVTAN